MDKLLRFEFRKVLRSKYLYIIFGIGLFLALISIPLIYLANILLKEIGQPTTPFSGYYAAKTALVNSNFYLIAGIFIAIFACEDFNLGTNKNIVAKGYNRISLFYSKYIVSLILVIAFSIIVVLFSLGFGYILYGDGGLSIDDNVAVIFLCQLVCVIAYHAFFFAISYSIARTGAAIAINIVVPTLLTSIVSVITVLLNNPDFVLSNFVIDGALANLSATYTNTEVILPSMLAIVGYTALFNGLGVLFANRKQF